MWRKSEISDVSQFLVPWFNKSLLLVEIPQFLVPSSNIFAVSGGELPEILQGSEHTDLYGLTFFS